MISVGFHHCQRSENWMFPSMRIYETIKKKTSRTCKTRKTRKHRDKEATREPQRKNKSDKHKTRQREAKKKSERSKSEIYNH